MSPQARKRQPPAGSSTTRRPRPAAKKAAKRARAGETRAPTAPLLPLAGSEPVVALVTAVEAAELAVEIAEHVGPDQAPVAVPTQFPLETGLVDYGMWVAMFDQTPPPPVPPGPFQRGRIWA